MRQRDVHAARVDHADVGEVHAGQRAMFVDAALAVVKDTHARRIARQRAAFRQPITIFDQDGALGLDGNRPARAAAGAAVLTLIRDVKVEPEELHASRCHKTEIEDPGVQSSKFKVASSKLSSGVSSWKLQFLMCLERSKLASIAIFQP